MYSLDRTERWLIDEVRSYEAAEKANGAELNYCQRESYEAIKTALECVQKVKADKKRMMDKFWEEEVNNG